MRFQKSVAKTERNNLESLVASLYMSHYRYVICANYFLNLGGSNTSKRRNRKRKRRKKILSDYEYSDQESFGEKESEEFKPIKLKIKIGTSKR